MKDFAENTAKAKGKKKFRSGKSKLVRKGGKNLSFDTTESSQDEIEEEFHLSDTNDKRMHADIVGIIYYKEMKTDLLVLEGKIPFGKIS